MLISRFLEKNEQIARQALLVFFVSDLFRSAS